MNRFVVVDRHFFRENLDMASQNGRERFMTRRLGRTVRIDLQPIPTTPQQISIGDLGMDICAIAHTFALLTGETRAYWPNYMF